MLVQHWVNASIDEYCWYSIDICMACWTKDVGPISNQPLDLPWADEENNVEPTILPIKCQHGPNK